MRRPPPAPTPSPPREEPAMGDAEIIPIGTRGRPGRGTGKQPSAAARNLSPGPRKVAPQRAEPAAQPAAQPADQPAAREGSRPPATAEARLPAGGIPATELLPALQQGARE